MRPAGLRNDAGVSSVVSAVLVFALFSTATLMYTINTLPDRIEAKEADNQARVREAFASLKGGLEALSASADAGPISATVPLAARPVALLQRGAATGNLQVEPDRFAANATWPSGTTAHLLDGQAVGAPTATVPGTLALVTDLRSFVVGLVSTGVGAAGDVARVTVSATSGSDTVTAVLEHSNSVPDCGARGVVLNVTAVSTTKTYTLLCAAGDALGVSGNPYTVSLLDDTYGFSAGLARLASPYSMTVAQSSTGSTVTGTYSAVWANDDGLMQTAGTGQSYSTALDEEGDILRYTPSNIEFVQQEVAWQGGAILARQSSQQAIISSPALTLATSGATGYLAWTLVDLTGEGGRGGSDSATVSVTHVATTEILLTLTASTTLTLTTNDAAGWSSFFNQTRLAGGLDGTTQLVVSPTTDGVSLTLVNGGAGGLTSWNVLLRLVQALVVVS